MAAQAKKATGTDLRSRVMVAPDGERYYPETAEEATLLHIEHGAVPELPDLWRLGGTYDPPPARPSCPLPEVCFPGGVDPSWSSIGCVHGQYDLA